MAVFACFAGVGHDDGRTKVDRAPFVQTGRRMLLSITVLPKLADVMHDRTTPKELIDKSPLL
jgi:hypothetical protein